MYSQQWLIKGANEAGDIILESRNRPIVIAHSDQGVRNHNFDWVSSNLEGKGIPVWSTLAGDNHLYHSLLILPFLRYRSNHNLKLTR